MYLSIVCVENNRITKYAKFDTEPAAQVHCDAFGGFVYTGTYSPDLYVDGETVTVQPKAETAEQTIKRLDAAIERHIQSVMDAKGYESIERLIGAYSNSPNAVWKAEANAAAQWLTSIWEYSLQVKSDVESEIREIPTEQGLLAELPSFESFLAA